MAKQEGLFSFSLSFSTSVYVQNTYRRSLRWVEVRPRHDPHSWEMCVCSFTSLANQYREDAQGAVYYRPYPKTLECQTICGYHNEDCTFSSVILETLSDVRSGVWTSCTAVRRSATWANQARFIILITICNSTRTFGKPERPIESHPTD